MLDMIICLAVFALFTNVTDQCTDRQKEQCLFEDLDFL